MPATVLVFVGECMKGSSVAAVMIGIDPHKGSHTAVAVA
jgi:hypothetical protein